MVFVQLLVFGLVFVCVRLSDARFLSERTYREVEPAAKSEPERSGESSPHTNMLQAKQIQTAREPLSWKFPEDPVDWVEQTPVRFEPQRPVAAERVAVRCGESRIRVEVSQDLLGLGRLIRPEDLTLGGCSVTEVDDSSHVLIFDYELHRCGSTLVMTENAFVYALELVYSSKVSGSSPITRSQSAVIGIECHYRT